jgi:hypothetical protein
MKYFLVLLLNSCLLMTIASAKETDWREKAADPKYLHQALKQVTDVIVYDVFSPPVASRTYAYTTIAAYEICRYTNKTYVTLAGQLKGLALPEAPEEGKEYNYSLAAVQAVLLVGKALVISEGRVDSFRLKLLQEFKGLGMPEDVYDRSVAYGKKMAEHILAWAAKDNYKQTRSFPRYTIGEDVGSWKPTPPAYMKAVEPHWSKMRSFVMDSAMQFKPIPATPFSAKKNTSFYKLANEVYTTGKNLTPLQKDIASFWDCNPFRMNVNGHVMYATKKISPGGHWINITRLVCEQSKADLVHSAEAYACLSIVLADAFISCWDEKYRSMVIRPETYINQYIDPNWMPLLQTPPFPEYTSGHSVVSAACSVMLTGLFGEHVAYSDSTETEFGLPVRHFTSFKQAAEEAAISRLYGGIHYMNAIKNGFDEGTRLGRFVAGKLKTKK